MADHYQLEDGSGNYELEDGSGAYLLEDAETIDVPFISSTTTLYTPDVDDAPLRARVSQLPVEVVVAPDDAKARISQMPVEVVIAPDDAAARVSQVPVEVVMRHLRETVSVIIID